MSIRCHVSVVYATLCVTAEWGRGSGKIHQNHKNLCGTGRPGATDESLGAGPFLCSGASVRESARLRGESILRRRSGEEGLNRKRKGGTSQLPAPPYNPSTQNINHNERCLSATVDRHDSVVNIKTIKIIQNAFSVCSLGDRSLV